eukprot:12102096-Prorocentrum_lima.AAC.1
MVSNLRAGTLVHAAAFAPMPTKPPTPNTCGQHIDGGCRRVGLNNPAGQVLQTLEDQLANA